MKEVIIASTNPAKIFQIRSALKLVGVEANGPNTELPEVVEDGETLIENACKKAISAAKFLKRPVMAVDNGLYFDALKDEEQPGTNVRRIPTITDRRPNDEEVLEYYSKLIKSFGDNNVGCFKFGVCVATSEGKVWTIEIPFKRKFTSIPCASRSTGYPMESLAIDLKSGKYIAEMGEEEKEIFWQENIGKELGEFVKSLEI